MKLCPNCNEEYEGIYNICYQCFDCESDHEYEMRSAKELPLFHKWVIVNLGDNIECRVQLFCIPDTPEDLLQRQALDVLRSALPQKKTSPMAVYGDAMQRIDDYNYLQGKGQRWEAEQRLNELMNKPSEEKGAYR